MHHKSLDARYFGWLTRQVAGVGARHNRRTFKLLLGQLHENIFVAIVPHDENRIADARDLRYEFFAESEQRGDSDWVESPCTMLELFVVLSRCLAFEMDDDASVWFWHLIEILDLERYDDGVYDNEVRDIVADAMAAIIWRTYDSNGYGGLFPLRNPREDQRKVELWYQLNAYLLEQF